MYQHLQSGGAHCRGSAREEGGGERADRKKRGQDLPCSWIADRDRVFEKGGSPALSRKAWILCFCLWLHHLHRECRASGSDNRGGHYTERPRLCCGAVW